MSILTNLTQSTVTKAMSPVKSITGMIPKSGQEYLNANLLTGKIDQVVDMAQGIIGPMIDTIIAPLNTIVGTVEGTFNVAEDTLSTARIAYDAARTAMPNTAAKLKVAVDRAETYKASVEKVKDNTVVILNQAQDYVEKIKNTIQNAITKGKDWLVDKINFYMNKLNEYISKGLEWIEKQLKKLEDKVVEAAKKEGEKIKARAEDMAKKKAESLKRKKEEQEKQKAQANAAMNAAPKI